MRGEGEADVDGDFTPSPTSGVGGTARGPCGFNHMSDGRRRQLLGAPRQPVDRARTDSAGRRAGGGRYSSNITFAGLEL